MFYLTKNTNDVHYQDSSVNNAWTIVIYSQNYMQNTTLCGKKAALMAQQVVYMVRTVLSAVNILSTTR
jgi:hypothetical protein